MIPIGTALIGNLAHSGRNCSDVLSAAECQRIGPALRSSRFSGLRRCHGLGGLPEGVSALGISSGKDALLPGTTAAFTSATEPATSLHPARSSHRGRPSMRFLFIGPPVSPSLPPPSRLPFRSWHRVVVVSRFHDRFSYIGLAPILQRAHDGRTSGSRIENEPGRRPQCRCAGATGLPRAFKPRHRKADRVFSRHGRRRADGVGVNWTN